MFQKTLLTFVAFLATAALAGPKEDAAALLAKTTGAELSIETKSIHDPVQFTVTTSKREIKISSDVKSFFDLVRSQSPSRTIRSGEYVYSWGWQILTLPGKSIFDLAADVPEYMYDPADVSSDWSPQTGFINYSYKLLSVMGPLVSVQVIGPSWAPGAAHPDASDEILSYDLSQAADADSIGTANLLNWVSEESLVSALKRDKYVRKIAKPSGLPGLERAQSVAQVSAVLEAPLSERCRSFPYYDKKLTNFAIADYDAKKGMVNVRIQISPSAHVCEAVGSKEVGLWVKPSAALEKYLVAAKKNGEGLFRNQVK